MTSSKLARTTSKKNQRSRPIPLIAPSVLESIVHENEYAVRSIRLTSPWIYFCSVECCRWATGAWGDLDRDSGGRPPYRVEVGIREVCERRTGRSGHWHGGGHRGAGVLGASVPGSFQYTAMSGRIVLRVQVLKMCSRPFCKAFS